MALQKLVETKKIKIRWRGLLQVQENSKLDWHVCIGSGRYFEDDNKYKYLY